MEACWRRSRQKGYPWEAIAQRLKVPPKQKPNPFTKEEITAIIQSFSEDRHYSYYTDFIRFLLWTGVRTGEAIELRWKHLSEECSNIWIGECVTRGVLRPAKTNRDRSFRLSAKVQEMLLNRKPEEAEPSDLVFPSPEGKAIDDHNFSQRIWKKILKRLSIPHRKLYSTRHSFISHCLEQGMNPVLISHLTGHDLETLLKNYAGVVNSCPTLPEI